MRYGTEFLGLFADEKLKTSNSILHSWLQNRLPFYIGALEILFFPSRARVPRQQF